MSLGTAVIFDHGSPEFKSLLDHLSSTEGEQDLGAAIKLWNIVLFHYFSPLDSFKVKLFDSKNREHGLYKAYPNSTLEVTGFESPKVIVEVYCCREDEIPHLRPALCEFYTGKLKKSSDVACSLAILVFGAHFDIQFWTKIAKDEHEHVVFPIAGWLPIRPNLGTVMGIQDKANRATLYVLLERLKNHLLKRRMKSKMEDDIDQLAWQHGSVQDMKEYKEIAGLWEQYLKGL